MLKQIDVEQLHMNPISMIGNEWMLISAGGKDGYNMMTASWGGVGVMWNKNTSSITLRPQRYTLEFVEGSDYYALNFFNKSHKKALAYCGDHSGRDVDKEKETGLTPVFDREAPYFAEAKLVLICRKLYKHTIDPHGFIDKTLDEQNYLEKDYHQCFIGEIVSVLVDEE